jgi:hypothetical protein
MEVALLLNMIRSKCSAMDMRNIIISIICCNLGLYTDSRVKKYVSWDPMPRSDKFHGVTYKRRVIFVSA